MQTEYKAHIMRCKRIGARPMPYRVWVRMVMSLRYGG